MQMHPSLIVHGGAWDIPEELHAAHLEGVRRAASAGWEILNSGGTALDAVEQAVRVMEDDPAFDAGRGSHLNADGHIEMDALIMDGSTLDNGAVAAIQFIANPISLARMVITHTEHALLVGAGAQAFAERMGVPLVTEATLLVAREIDRWRSGQQSKSGSATGTVGAVARDSAGHIAAATSTGGTPNKQPGRVGDSPLVGCGGYADDLLGGASSTGQGECLMKIVMCKTVCDLMGSGLSAQQACEEGIRRLAEGRVQGLGGVIAIDQKGRPGAAYSTPHMARAVVMPDGSIDASL